MGYLPSSLVNRKTFPSQSRTPTSSRAWDGKGHAFTPAVKTQAERPYRPAGGRSV